LHLRENVKIILGNLLLLLCVINHDVMTYDDQMGSLMPAVGSW